MRRSADIIFLLAIVVIVALWMGDWDMPPMPEYHVNTGGE